MKLVILSLVSFFFMISAHVKSLIFEIFWRNLGGARRYWRLWRGGKRGVGPHCAVWGARYIKDASETDSELNARENERRLVMVMSMRG